MTHQQTGRTVHFLVGDVIKPAPEPFMVLRVDTAVRRENGVEGTVQSLHMTRDEAIAYAQREIEGRLARRSALAESSQ